MSQNHSERAHSKFSASGSERWLNCPASVRLEEMSPPKKSTAQADEGTRAHELLESVLKGESDLFKNSPGEMRVNVAKVAARIEYLWQRTPGAPLLVEKKIFNNEIHEEMFGTCDVIIPQYRGTLHIDDFKYGTGHIVDPKENTQLIQYALGVCEAYDWQFESAELHIMQPRGGTNWHKTWSVSIDELRRKWLPKFRQGVKRAEDPKAKPNPGAWCYWCKANGICPAKVQKRFNEVTNRFKEERGKHGEEKSKKENGEEVIEEIDEENFGEEIIEDFY